MFSDNIENGGLIEILEEQIDLAPLAEVVGPREELLHVATVHEHRVQVVGQALLGGQFTGVR